MDVDKAKFGNRVRSIRKAKGLNQEELGNMMDNPTRGENAANKPVVSAWERGISVPGPYRLKVIADLGGITVNELLYGKSVDPVVELLEQEIAKLAPTGDYSQGLIEGLNIAKELLIKNKNL